MVWEKPLGLEEGFKDGARWSWLVQWWWMAVDCYTRLRWRRQTDIGNGVFAGLGSGILKRLFCWLAQSWAAELICSSWFRDGNKNNSITCADNHRGVVVVIVCGRWILVSWSVSLSVPVTTAMMARSKEYWLQASTQNWLANSTEFGNSINV